MRERTSASQACGSTPFIFAVTMRLYMAAARRPPRSDPQNSHDFLSQRDAAQSALGGVVRETNAAILKEQGKGRPALEHVIDGFDQVVPAREPGGCSRI